MLRFLSFLFFNKQYETCKSCETLKQQLAIANEEKHELTQTLLGLIKPKVYEAAPVSVEPIVPQLTMFSRKRAALESASREAARTLRNSKDIGRPDTSNQSITNLERELISDTVATEELESEAN